MQCKILVSSQSQYSQSVPMPRLYIPRNNNRIFCVPQTVSIIQLAKSTLLCSFSLWIRAHVPGPGLPQLAEFSVIAVRRRGKICGWCNPILSPQPQQGTAGHCGIATLAAMARWCIADKSYRSPQQVPAPGHHWSWWRQC